MTNLSTLFFLVVVMTVIAVFGSHFTALSQPDLSSNILTFIGNLATFSIPGAGFVASLVFDVLGIMAIALVYTLVRGTN